MLSETADSANETVTTVADNRDSQTVCSRLVKGLRWSFVSLIKEVVLVENIYAAYSYTVLNLIRQLERRLFDQLIVYSRHAVCDVFYCFLETYCRYL